MEKVFVELIRQLKENPEQIPRLMLKAEAAFESYGYRETIPVGVNDILIVRLDAIGNMVLTSGFLREVRTNFPQARITLVCSPLTYPIVELCPYVNEVLTFDKNALDKNFPAIFEQIADFCRKNLWQRHFGLAFSPQWGSDNLPAVLMTWLSGARDRVGYGKNPYGKWGIEFPAEESVRDNFLLTKNIVAPRDAVAEVAKMFYILEDMGLATTKDNMELFFGAADFLKARDLFANVPPDTKKVLLGLSAGAPNKKYPVEKYLVALRKLAEKDLVFVIVGGQDVLDDANFIQENLPAEKVLNLAGKTTLRETEAVVGLTDCYVGNVTGVMHMAAAAQLPSIVLYREAEELENYLPGAFSEFRRFPPWQTKSIILRPDRQLEDCAARGEIYGWCHHDEAHCITQIPPSQIVEAFEALDSL